MQVKRFREIFDRILGIEEDHTRAAELKAFVEETVKRYKGAAEIVEELEEVTKGLKTGNGYKTPRHFFNALHGGLEPYLDEYFKIWNDVRHMHKEEDIRNLLQALLIHIAIDVNVTRMTNTAQSAQRIVEYEELVERVIAREYKEITQLGEALQQFHEKLKQLEFLFNEDWGWDDDDEEDLHEGRDKKKEEEEYQRRKQEILDDIEEVVTEFARVRQLVHSLLNNMKAIIRRLKLDNYPKVEFHPSEIRAVRIKGRVVAVVAEFPKGQINGRHIKKFIEDNEEFLYLAGSPVRKIIHDVQQFTIQVIIEVLQQNPEFIDGPQMKVEVGLRTGSKRFTYRSVSKRGDVQLRACFQIMAYAMMWEATRKNVREQRLLDDLKLFKTTMAEYKRRRHGTGIRGKEVRRVFEHEFEHHGDYLQKEEVNQGEYTSRRGEKAAEELRKVRRESVTMLRDYRNKPFLIWRRVRVQLAVQCVLLADNKEVRRSAFEEEGVIHTGGAYEVGLWLGYFIGLAELRKRNKGQYEGLWAVKPTRGIIQRKKDCIFFAKGIDGILSNKYVLLKNVPPEGTDLTRKQIQKMDVNELLKAYWTACTQLGISKKNQVITEEQVSELLKEVEEAERKVIFEAA